MISLLKEMAVKFHRHLGRLSGEQVKGELMRFSGNTELFGIVKTVE